MKRQLLILCLAHAGVQQLQSMSLLRSDEGNLLHYAEKGDYQNVEALLKKGIDPNTALTASSKDWRKSSLTPLMLAAKYNHPKVVDLLVKYGADATLTNDFGVTALHLAAWKGNVDVIKQLIAHGASVTAKDNDWATPLKRAIQKGHAAAAQELINNGALRGAEPERQQLSALNAAITANLPEMVELLVKNGIDVNIASLKEKVVGREGRMVFDEWIRIDTPLAYAVRLGHANIVGLLLKHGADATVKVFDDEKNDDIHHTILQLAEIYHHPQIANLIKVHQNQQKTLAQEKEKKEIEEKIEHMPLSEKIGILEEVATPKFHAQAELLSPQALTEKEIATMSTMPLAPEEAQIEGLPHASQPSLRSSSLGFEEAPPSYESLFPPSQPVTLEASAPLLEDVEEIAQVIAPPQKKLNARKSAVLA